MRRTRATPLALPRVAAEVERAQKEQQRVQTGMLRQIATAEARMIDFDHGAQSLFKPYKKSAPIRLLDVASKLGDQPELRTIAGTLILLGTFLTSDRMVRAGARMMIAHEAATATKDLLKTNIDRTRPRSAKNRKQKKPRKGHHTAKEKTSFPSGHSAGAIAAARAFSREYPEYAAPALGAAGLIALSQIPRCAHYPTDVMAGVAIGFAAEKSVDVAWAAARMEQRSELDQE